MAGRKPLKDKNTEKTEKIVVYLNKIQSDRLNNYAQKRLGEARAESGTVRTILFHYLDSQGF